MRRLAALALVTFALDGCYLAHEREAVAQCAVDARGGCASWAVAGAAQLVSSEHVYAQLTSVVPSGCGVFAAWSTLDGPFPEPRIAFETRALGWDAQPLAPSIAHPGLEYVSSTAGQMELATRADAMGALVEMPPEGCRFQALDATGADVGAPVALGAGCAGLAATESGYSFFSTTATGTPGSLVSIDAAGTTLDTVALGIAPRRSLWSRTLFDDGSFLTYSFSEDLTTNVYSGWLQHFDARGLPLHAEVDVGVNGVPVHSVPTRDGAFTLWTTATPGGLPMQRRVVDRDGVPRSEVSDVPAAGAQYGAELAPTGDGGALAMWLESHFEDEPMWRLRAQAFGPDGLPRADPTELVTGDHGELGRVLVEPSGQRALMVFDDDVGVRALPLSCAD